MTETEIVQLLETWHGTKKDTDCIRRGCMDCEIFRQIPALIGSLRLERMRRMRAETAEVKLLGDLMDRGQA